MLRFYSGKKTITNTAYDDASTPLELGFTAKKVIIILSALSAGDLKFSYDAINDDGDLEPGEPITLEPVWEWKHPKTADTDEDGIITAEERRFMAWHISNAHRDRCSL